MLRLGPRPAHMREMRNDDILMLRLRLLIIMSKAYLEGCELGTYRKEAVIGDAEEVASISISFSDCGMEFGSDEESKGKTDFDHVFSERVRLLAMMAKAFAEGYPMGNFRDKALKDNVDEICSVIRFSAQMGNMRFLLVA
jgi:hypothetical protein